MGGWAGIAMAQPGIKGKETNVQLAAEFKNKLGEVQIAIAEKDFKMDEEILSLKDKSRTSLSTSNLKVYT